ncbi:unnamed protein product [Trichobilharzia szidati]|nr:unnamed protein product [Trichobilharzia szidati]
MQVDNKVIFKPTIRCPLMINPEKDAERINKSIKLIDTDEDIINEILGHRNFQQRMAIAEAYKRLYDKDITEHLGSVLLGGYDSLVKTMFRNPMEILANDLYKGMKTLGSNYQIMTDIICCCNNTEIYLLKKAYDKILMAEDPKCCRQRSLETDVMRESKGAYKLFMQQLLKGERCEDSKIQVIPTENTTEEALHGVNQQLVADDVNELYEASEGQVGKGDPSVFISILSKRSKYHIQAIYNAYYKKYGHLLVDAISRKFSNPLRTAMNTVIMALIDLRLLLICQLYCSMEGIGMNEDTVIRIICLRCEIDLQNIKELYEKFFYKPLTQSIASETQGGLKKLLLILLNCE